MGQQASRVPAKKQVQNTKTTAEIQARKEEGYLATKSQTSPKESKAPDFKNPAQLVTLYASKSANDKKLLVHKDFVCRYSPVLNAALNGLFLEGETQSYKLSTTDVVLDILVQWLYTQKIEVDQFEPHPVIHHYYDLEPLTWAWILGDELIMPSFQNECMKAMIAIKKYKSVILPDCFAIWNATSGGSPLRVDLVHCVFLTWGIVDKKLGTEEGKITYFEPSFIPPEMMVAMFEEARSVISATQARKLNLETSIEQFKVRERK
ncbi:hypothetical protein GLAREA_00270 [Glarea lozoyensis ATCC 20868]|uniref:BTB domain-containing protein n=1 Tax=Glarea lozoyensis (strain ATCC 20868 / MF5171) TaxID=1116229 RepID=S3CRK9_GLAL2|nr:uncharacterized protein GLAREA_00270 [Glarea lozoyensis ATCC 20868]EPE29112.1 hypothetical protein GLAREA_00270 [Glarea lozoyensis ATCC 20868]